MVFKLSCMLLHYLVMVNFPCPLILIAIILIIQFVAIEGLIYSALYPEDFGNITSFLFLFYLGIDLYWSLFL